MRDSFDGEFVGIVGADVIFVGFEPTDTGFFVA